MAAPPKPWEKAGINSQHMTTVGTPVNMGADSGMTASGLHGSPSVSQLQPPAVPPRPAQQSPYGSSYNNYGYSSYSGLGSSFSPFGTGYSGMYGAGSYGGYGGYGAYGMNRFGGLQNDSYTTNSFVRQAEENSRIAFQSVESVVQAFGAVSMMMESTYCAVYNSFRAVLGVADQFSRVKTQLVQILCTLAILKRLKWLFKKLLVLLRLRRANLPEDVWIDAARSAFHDILPDGADVPKKSNWPIFVFVTLIIGAPWLIWKALSSMAGSTDADKWKTGETEHYTGVALHSFVGQSSEELSFQAGQKLRLAPKGQQPKVRGWLLATVDGQSVGLVPANYLKILGKNEGSRKSEQMQSTDAGKPNIPANSVQPQDPLSSNWPQASPVDEAPNMDTSNTTNGQNEL